MDSILSLKKLGKKGNLLIVFSARDTLKGKFTFYSMCQNLDLNIIFVNDYSNQWYLDGTPEFSDHDSFLVHLKSEIKKLLAPTKGKLYTLGSSMGAYAALKYGSLLGADKILALGPESELMLPHGRSVSSVKQLPEDKGDISGLHYKKPENVLILSGNNDIVDFYCACAFKSKTPNLNVSLINNRTHVVAKYINANFGLEKVLNEFFIEDEITFLEKMDLNLTAPLEQAESIRQFDDHLKRNDVMLSHRDHILSAAKSFPTWSMAQFFAAKLCLDLKDFNKAISYLDKSLHAQESLGRARLLLANVHCEQKNYKLALQHFNYLKENNFTYAIATLGLDIYTASNDIINAKKLLVEIQSLILTDKQKENIKKRREKLLKKEEQLIIKNRLDNFSHDVYENIDKAHVDVTQYNNANTLKSESIFINSFGSSKNNKIYYKNEVLHSRITVNYFNASDSNIFINESFSGNLEINIYSDDAFIYVGNKLKANNLQIDLNPIGSTCIIGENVTISSGCSLFCSEQRLGNTHLPLLLIGDNSSVSSNVLIGTCDAISQKEHTAQEFIPLKIIIGKDSLMGAGSKVLGCVTVEPGSYIDFGEVRTSYPLSKSMHDKAEVLINL